MDISSVATFKKFENFDGKKILFSDKNAIFLK